MDWFAAGGVTVERVLSDNGSSYRFLPHTARHLRPDRQHSWSSASATADHFCQRPYSAVTVSHQQLENLPEHHS